MAGPENTPSAKRKCAGCGAELAVNAPGVLCPKCLLKLAMETQAAAGPGGTVVRPGSPAKSRGLPQPGEQLGHYSIVRLLGAGGMGAVYEAQDLESGRRVALKVLSQALDSPEARERFLREGSLAASINHPNSVYVFGTEEIGGTPVIAMELVSGGTLQDRVRARGPMLVGEAVDCALQIIAGLEAAQRIGILHRDIKPSNCYVDEDDTVKVGDFGLSISTALRTEPALTATGVFLGTPAFCSPEQLRGEELNVRSDMYAVGVTLYYLLTGRTPFEADNVVRLLAIALEQPAPSPRNWRPDIPKGLAKSVLCCLEKNPGERFRNYAELERALAPFSSAAPTAATLSLRFVAGAVDTTILCGLAAVINLSVFGTPVDFMEQVMKLSPKALLAMFGGFLAMTFYYGLLEGLWGAAAGKALCRLRVVGPDRNPPGFARAWARALIFVLPPLLPYWVSFGANPRAYMGASLLTQLLMGFSIYGVMALLFATARRSNGFAAVQDLLTKTRVVSRAVVARRAPMPAGEPPPPVVESAATIGPYHVLQGLGESGGAKWFLGYDLKLLRKVWLRVVAPGTEPVPLASRNLSRIGRLRWLTGKRSQEENWDAFEAPTGRPLLELVQNPQPWEAVRYWLDDLAAEISAAERDGTLPGLKMDRIWITGDGRAKLLDFPAPGQAENTTQSAEPPLASSGFLAQVARLASQGAGARATQYQQVATPLHARAFLENLPYLSNVEAVSAALKPLLRRVAAVSRWRRAALVAGCIVFPVLGSLAGLLGMSGVNHFYQRNPGFMELSTLLQMRSSMRSWAAKHVQFPSDHLVGVFIAQHYRGLITNQTAWTSPLALAMLKGEGRKFAEQSVAQYGSVSPEEIKEADGAVSKFVAHEPPFSGKSAPYWLPLAVLICLFVYVSIPALLAALAFRGGLVLLLAGVTFVRWDGRQASRLRLLWRAIVTWSPCFLAFVVTMAALIRHISWIPWLALVLVSLLALVSVGVPERGLQDRLAGTWPVPR